MSTNNRLVCAIARLFLRKKIWAVNFEFHREVYDSELLYSAFIRQSMAELQEHFDKQMETLQAELDDSNILKGKE